MRLRWVIFFFSLMAISACNDTGTRDQVADLDGSIKQYNIALRWGQYDKLNSFHVSKDGQRNRVDVGTLKNIRITSHTVLEKELNNEMTGATINGEYHYYHNDRGIVVTKPYRQVWWYDADLKRWFVETEFPVFD